MTQDALDTLFDLRSTAALYFSEQQLTVAQIVTIKTNTIPMDVLAFQYYGSDENAESLINLNKITNVSTVSGTLDIVSK